MTYSRDYMFAGWPADKSPFIIRDTIIFNAVENRANGQGGPEIMTGYEPKTPAATIASRLAREATKLGYTLSADRSGLSASRYLIAVVRCASCVADDDGECTCEPPVKIRISDHELPPTYGRLNGYADYEVILGSAADRPEANGDWLHCLEWLARRAGREPTATMRTSRTKRDREQATRDQQRAAAHAAYQAAADAEAAREALRRAWKPERWAELAAIQGAKGREKRRLYRRQADAALGLSRG